MFVAPTPAQAADDQQEAQLRRLLRGNPFMAGGVLLTRDEGYAARSLAARVGLAWYPKAAIWSALPELLEHIGSLRPLSVSLLCGGVLRHRDRTFVLDGVSVKFSPLQYQLFRRLSAKAGDLVTYDELIEGLGSMEDIGNDALYRNVSRLRRAFAGAGLPLVIETVRSRGYRLLTPTSSLPGNVTRG